MGGKQEGLTGAGHPCTARSRDRVFCLLPVPPSVCYDTGTAERGGVMSLFLILMFAGLAGLALMALPGLARHGHAGVAAHGPGHLGHGAMHAGHGVGHAGHGAGHMGHGAGHAGHGAGHGGHGAGHTSGEGAAPGAQHAAGASSEQQAAGLFWRLPSPRLVFSLMTLFGAFGFALTEGGHLPPALAGLVAVIPAVLIERYAVTPLWNLLLGFEGTPSAPLDELVLKEATAVTPFHNGRGLVSVVREGRVVQLRAEMAEPQDAAPVRVGDTLSVEEVDAAHERVVVKRHGQGTPAPERRQP